METKQLEQTLKNLADANLKPAVRGTTLITYIVPGGIDA
jgi:hypothetical protein